MRVFLITILSFFFPQLVLASGNSNQFNVLFGMDKPQSGETRSGGASLLKFGITNRPDKILRFSAAFAYVTGGGLQQGEFTIGPLLYPFASYTRAAVQPFLFGEGVIGVGTYLEKIRTDAGGAFGVGIDFKTGNKWGITLAIDEHLATETSRRLFLGVNFLSE